MLVAAFLDVVPVLVDYFSWPLAFTFATEPEAEAEIHDVVGHYLHSPDRGWRDPVFLRQAAYVRRQRQVAVDHDATHEHPPVRRHFARQRRRRVRSTRRRPELEGSDR